MGLIGALSNRATQDRIARLSACRRALLKNRRALSKPTPRPSARPGEMVKAVEAVLAKSGESMRVSEIQHNVVRGGIATFHIVSRD